MILIVSCLETVMHQPTLWQPLLRRDFRALFKASTDLMKVIFLHAMVRKMVAALMALIFFVLIILLGIVLGHYN